MPAPREIPGAPAHAPARRREVKIERIAAGGDGVAREPSGRVVFVPRTAPGDRVWVDIVERHRRWARARALGWVAHGPERRVAACPAYEARCGGCRLQHLSGAGQRAAKRDMVRETLRRIGKLSVDVSEPIAAGGEFGYRNRVTFTVRGDGQGLTAGYRDFEAPDRLVDVEDCPLAEPAVRAAWRTVRQVWEDSGRPVPSGCEARITVRGSVAGEVDLLLDEIHRGGEWDLEALLQGVPELVGCHVRVGRTPKLVHGKKTLADRWQGLSFELPPGVFLQVNREVSSRIDRWLEERVGNLADLRILDLYAGVGARAVHWALQGAQVVACEVSVPACRAGRAVARREGVRVDFVTGRVEQRLRDLLPADVVVVNPPRAGLAAEASAMLAQSDVERLAYVSCDPATLARDLERLSGGWHVVDVQPFDAFPQTAHVETAVWMERRRAGASHA